MLYLSVRNLLDLRRVNVSKGKVLKMDGPSARGLTGFRPEGYGRLTAAGCVEGLRKKVLRIDGPFRAQRFLSLTALRAEGCGIALAGDAYKVSVTGLAFCVIGHEKHSADWLAALATPYPGCAGLLHGKACHTILRSLCSLTNRVPLPPLCRGQNRFLRFPAETWLHG